VASTTKETSKDGASSDFNDEEDESEEESVSEADSGHGNVNEERVREDSPTSSSGSSSDGDEETTSELSSNDSESIGSSASSESLSDTSVPRIPAKLDTESKSLRILPLPQSSSGSTSVLSITIPNSTIAKKELTSEIHPLEALYKRPQTGLETSLNSTQPTFSFFGADADADEDHEAEQQDQVPITPYTQQEFEFRRSRSAAPTPDTAHHNKRFIWPKDNEIDEEQGEGASPTPKNQATQSRDAADGDTPVNDFQKWFYEHRGEVNRAWKKKRKLAAKEKRQRENRKRQDRLI